MIDTTTKSGLIRITTLRGNHRNIEYILRKRVYTAGSIYKDGVFLNFGYLGSHHCDTRFDSWDEAIDFAPAYMDDIIDLAQQGES